MAKKIFYIDKSLFFKSLNFNRGPAKIIRISKARLKKNDASRLDALEKAILMYLVEDFKPPEDEAAIFDLNGSPWYLQGNGLSLLQMRELKKRFKNWHITEKEDRLGKFLKLVPKTKNPKPA